MMPISTLVLVAALSGWSTSASSPTLLAGGSGEQVQPKLSWDGRGMLALSWYDAPSGFDVMVRQLTTDGDFTWPTATVVMNNSFSSTQDYQLFRGAPWAVASQQGSSSPVAAVASLNTDGTLAWTRTVSGSSASVPKGNRADDGFLWSAWVEGSNTRVQRLSQADGGFSFGAPIQIGTTGSAFAADVEPALSGSGVVVSTVRYSTFSGPKVLWANLINPDGSQPWGSTGKQVFASGSLQFGNFPEFKRVPSLGHLFAYYKTSPLQSYVQVLDAQGNRLFGTEGFGVTGDTSRERTNPAAVADGQYVYVCWIEHTPNSSIYGVYAQCFDVATGTRQWGVSGLPLAALETVYSYSGAVAHLRPEGVVFGWVRSTAFGQDTVEAMCVNAAGATVWDRRPVATNASPKGRMQAHGVPYGTILLWEDGITQGSSDIRGMRIGADGSLGPAVRPSPDLNGDGSINGADLGALLAAWSGEPGESPADLNADGVVDGADLGGLLTSWAD